jgi:CRISPR-associated protein Cas1
MGMKDIPGMVKPNISALPRIGDRISFLYIERCQINCQDSAITITDEAGTAYIPAAMFSVLLLGPGTRITHKAVELIGDSGMTILWVGEKGVRFYAYGRSLTMRTRLLLKQAKLVSNQRYHAEVVRKMYQLRFQDEDVTGLTVQQLRGKEGSRVRAIYRKAAKEWNIPWNGREYDPDHFESGTAVNQALSAGHACLYGLAHSVIVALGCSPGLGFVHVGHENSFVYDVADLYKADITIPLAFEVASETTDDLPGTVRRRTRDLLYEKHILERMVKDIQYLLNDSDDEDPEEASLYLWDDIKGTVNNATSY